MLTKLLNEYGSHIAYRFGCTGTLPKPEADAMAVRIAIGDVVHTKPAHELIEEGYLARLHISVMQLDEPFKEQYEEWKRDNPGVKMTHAEGEPLGDVFQEFSCRGIGCLNAAIGVVALCIFQYRKFSRGKHVKFFQTNQL